MTADGGNEATTGAADVRAQLIEKICQFTSEEMAEFIRRALEMNIPVDTGEDL